MEAVYTYLKDCDRILLASPIYFSELTGSLLNVISRLQPYFYARYFRKEPIPLHIQKAVTVTADLDFMQTFQKAMHFLNT